MLAGSRLHFWVEQIGRTITIFESLLDHWIIDVCQDLQILQVHMHPHQSPLLRIVAALQRGWLFGNFGNAFPLLFYLDELLSTVRCKDLASFLEALVGELLKGDTLGGLEGGTAAAGADGLNTGKEKLFFFFAGGYEVGVEGRGRGRRVGSSGGFEGSFIESKCGGCKVS